MKRKTWTITVQCGEGEHEMTISLNGKGEVNVFSPCQLLSETARKLMGNNCIENLFKCLVRQLLHGDLDQIANSERETKEKIPRDIAIDILILFGKVTPDFKALRDPRDPEVKIAATLLCSPMVRDGERYEAATKLVRKRATGVLIRVLKEGDEKSRYLAAEALGKVEGKKARKALEKALEEEKSEWVRRRIVWALGKVGNERSISHLVKAMKREDSEGVIWLMAEAIGQISKEKGAT